jgi:hypothetical protein
MTGSRVCGKAARHRTDAGRLVTGTRVRPGRPADQGHGPGTVRVRATSPHPTVKAGTLHTAIVGRQSIAAYLAIKLNSRGQIVQLTSIWDGSLVTPAWITQHMSLTIESLTPGPSPGLSRRPSENSCHAAATAGQPGVPARLPAGRAGHSPRSHRRIARDHQLGTCVGASVRCSLA